MQNAVTKHNLYAMLAQLHYSNGAQRGRMRPIMRYTCKYLLHNIYVCVSVCVVFTSYA